MISPVGTDRTGGMTGMSDSVNRPAKLPLFDPIFPLFEHDRPDHNLTARKADRAVLVILRRFLAGIHAILETLISVRSVVRIYPGPLDLPDSGGRCSPIMLANWLASSTRNRLSGTPREPS